MKDHSEKNDSYIQYNKEVWIPSLEEVERERKRIRRGKRFRSTMRSTTYVLLATVAVVIIIVSLFMPVMQVTGTSMEPTLESGNVVVLWKTGKFETGDLCGFYYQNKVLIKRIIGTPGDWVNIDEDGYVSVNGKLLDEPYISEHSLGENDLTFPYQVPDNKFFVLGDHRETAMDSRSEAIGCVERDQLVGRVLLRVWPLKEFDLLK